MPRRFIFILLTIIPLLLTFCKRKPKKTIEELPTQVETFKPDTYLESSLDSIDIERIKAFGSEIDSIAFQEDIQAISKIIKADENNETYHTKNGITYTVIKYGGGEYPVKGDLLQVQVETSTLEGEKVFSTKDLKQPLQFVLGVGQVVPAWDDVFLNVQEGTQFQVIAPSALSYGKKGHHKYVKSNTILKYDITFEKIIPQKDDISKNQPKLKINEGKDSKEKENKIPLTIRKPQ